MCPLYIDYFVVGADVSILRVHTNGSSYQSIFMSSPILTNISGKMA